MTERYPHLGGREDRKLKEDAQAGDCAGKAPMAQKLAVVRDVQLEPLEIGKRREICNVGRWMYRRGFVVACEGNLSVRLDANRILVTPAGTCKGMLAPEDLLITDLNGRVIGINLSRAGRVETWAIPAEIVHPLIAELKSGRLAPEEN